MRRVVIKVAVSDQGVNTRFVVTDMEHARTQVVSRHLYCARGQMENEIKDHKLGSVLKVEISLAWKATKPCFKKGTLSR